MTSKTTNKFSPEVRERAVRMVRDHGGDHASQWAAISSIAPKIGCTPETLRKWMRQTERDQGTRPRKTLGWKTPAEALDQLLAEAGNNVATTA